MTKATAARTSREHIRQIAVLDEPYSVEDGTLTRTMKPRRPAIAERYADVITTSSPAYSNIMFVAPILGLSVWLPAVPEHVATVASWSSVTCRVRVLSSPPRFYNYRPCQCDPVRSEVQTSVTRLS